MSPARTLLLLFGSCVAVAQADTLLVARAAGQSLEFFDPGSGLRLAAIHVSCAPHKISVSPDGRRAAVACSPSVQPGRPEISLVDLEHPAELRRFATTDPDAQATLDWVVTTTSSDGRRAYALDASRGRVRLYDARTGSVLRELDVGLRPDAIAVTDAVPHAVCHACQKQ